MKVLSFSKLLPFGSFKQKHSFNAGVFLEIENVSRTPPASECEDDDEEDLSLSTPVSSSPPMSWKSATRRSFLQGQPLCVCDPDHPSEEITDPVEALGKKMERSKELPGTWYYSSNHVMVNMERRNRVVAPLTRKADLDDVARQHALEMAAKGELFHSDPYKLHLWLASKSKVMGENVAVGDNIRTIHKNMLENREQTSNMLHRRYTQFGMGTAKSSDGRLFLCQVYRG